MATHLICQYNSFKIIDQRKTVMYENALFEGFSKMLHCKVHGEKDKAKLATSDFIIFVWNIKFPTNIGFES